VSLLEAGPLPPPSDLRVVLCDADGNLFPSEEPAFAASATVTNDFLARLGSPRRWDAEELRRAALGRNFRTLATEMAAELGVDVPAQELEAWVEREKTVVTRHLASVLQPDEAVTSSLQRLGERLRLAVVSSSALDRLAACFTATGLDDAFAAVVRFSAQDSLAVPTSKPDPAVYLWALDKLGLGPTQAVAVEDAAAGVRSAVAAGIWTIGNLAFVPAQERAARAAELRACGAAEIADDWSGVEEIIAARMRLEDRPEDRMGESA
jgi:HAD superfamily hydrolase (TIGR01509 family)